MISRTFTVSNVYRNSVLEFRRDDRGQPLAQALHIRRDGIVSHDRQLLARLTRGLLTELDVLGGAVFVAGRRYAGLAAQADGSERNNRRRTQSTSHVVVLLQMRILERGSIGAGACLISPGNR